MKFTAAQIAGILEGDIIGDPDVEVSKLSKIEEGTEGSLTFLANPKYKPYIYSTQASITIVNKTFEAENKLTTTLIKVEDAYKSFSKLLEYYNQIKINKFGIEQPSFIAENSVYGLNVYIGAFAYIGEHVTIGNNVKIFPGSYIGDNVTIGENTLIFAGTKIYSDCVIGSNCVINSCCVIGADGFGFAPNENGEYSKVPQTGNVIIEDFVDIGASCTIDRGVTGDTTIKVGSKIDNLVQIGHDTVIGKKCLIASQVGIAGCVVVEDEVTFWGQVGCTSGVTIGSKAVILAQSGISKSLDGGKTYFGTPAEDIRTKYKELASIKQIPEILQTIKSKK